MFKIKGLEEHMFGTYRWLRYVIGALGIVLPFVLLLGGYLNSMSAYYCLNGNVTLQHLYVGILCSVGFGLYIYKGFTVFEDVALNLAAIFVILTAFFPTKECGTEISGKLHVIFALLFFMCICYVCYFRASDTLGLISEETSKNFFGKIYKYMGIAMFFLPILTLLIDLAVDYLVGDSNIRVNLFIPEAIAVVVFGSYWIVKAIEIKKSVNEDLINGKLVIKYEWSDIINRELRVERIEPESSSVKREAANPERGAP